MPHRVELKVSCLQRVIDLRCTDNALLAFSVSVALLAIVMQTVSLVTTSWIYVYEPRISNLTDPITGLEREVNYVYYAGYFKMCRERLSALNETLSDEELIEFSSPEYAHQCLWVELLPDDDMSAFSKATAPIMLRVQTTAVLHVLSLVLTIVATGYSLAGFRHEDRRSIIAGTIYIVGGLTMCVAILQYICVVDDEMFSRMKKYPDADKASVSDPRYYFSYEYSYFLASSSFLPIQVSAVGNVFLYLRRFPHVTDKCRMVPGLREKGVSW